MSQRRETVVVPAAAGGQRLDLWLAGTLANVSRRAVKKALDSGQVFVDGRCERHAGAVLRGGERVVVTVEAPPAPPVAPELVILYRDEHLLAIDKPPRLPAHPTVAGRANALELVAARLREEGDSRTPILLHRLDADTSGVLLFALTPEANRSLYRQFVEHSVEKIYLALVVGNPPETFTVRNHLKAGVRGRTVAVSSGGQTAETVFRTLQTLTRSPLCQRGDGGDFALIEARPTTGRTHQIRAHLSGAGHPLLGDVLYGGPAAFNGQSIRRHLLHASRLSVTHPQGGERVTVAAPLPADFRTVAGECPAAGG